MSELIQNWARRWGVPEEAVCDLVSLSANKKDANLPAGFLSEADVTKWVQVGVSKKGGRVWRNNVGVAMHPETSRPVRYGLCNESKSMNSIFKSSDLIGITPVTIRPEDIGKKVGVFTAYETKKTGWNYRGSESEKAQFNFISLVISLGGIASFSTGGVL